VALLTTFVLSTLHKTKTTKTKVFLHHDDDHNHAHGKMKQVDRVLINKPKNTTLLVNR